MRKTLTFSDEGEKLINDWRKKQDKIPSFNAAVNQLIDMGLKAADWLEQQKKIEAEKK